MEHVVTTSTSCAGKKKRAKVVRIVDEGADAASKDKKKAARKGGK